MICVAQPGHTRVLAMGLFEDHSGKDLPQFRDPNACRVVLNPAQSWVSSNPHLP